MWSENLQLDAPNCAARVEQGSKVQTVVNITFIPLGNSEAKCQ